MISLPTYYVEENVQVMYNYYGKFIWHVAERNQLKNMYGLTGDMLNDALKEYGARLGDSEILFENDAKSTMFILRWS